MRYKTILFDLDGTLLDTSAGVLGSFAKAEEELGLAPLPPDMRRQVIGPTLYDSFVNLYGLDDERAKAAVACYRKYYESGGVLECRPYEGIAQLLQKLREKGVRLCVTTSKYEPFARLALESQGLLQYFDALYAPDAGRKDSNKASLLLSAIEEGTPPFLMVGDRKYDIEGARANDIDSAYLLSGFGSREEAELCRPEYLFEDVSQLSAFLLGNGLFLCFEGVDGTGKTTQIHLVKQYLEEKGYTVCLTREPGGTKAAEGIRDLLLDPKLTIEPVAEAYLYAAARAEHVRGTIRPALARGEIVLCDRFLASSIAYQGYGRGLGEETVRSLNEYAVARCLPDRTYLFLLDDEQADKRAASRSPRDRIELAGAAFRQRVRSGYEAIGRADMQNVHTVYATGSIEEVFARVRADLDAYLAGI